MKADKITKLESLSPAVRGICALGRVWGRRRGSTKLLNAVRRRLCQELTAGELLEIPLCGSSVRVAVPWEELSGETLVTFGENDENIFRFLLCAFGLRRELAGCFVDIGANLGSFSLRIASLCRSEVVAFEPQVKLAELLELNATRNGLGPLVTVLREALAADEGPLQLRLDSTNSGLARIESASSACAIEECHQVPGRRLDGSVSNERWQRTFAVKIDAEGYELEILKGGGALFETAKPPLILELNSPEMKARGYSSRDIGTLLRSYGYDMFFGLGPALYPISNGIALVGDIVALPPSCEDIVALFGYNKNYKPPHSKYLPVVRCDM